MYKQSNMTQNVNCGNMINKINFFCDYLYLLYIALDIRNIQTYNNFNIRRMPQNKDAKPFLEEIIAIVIDFLDKKAGEKDIANQLRENYQERQPQWMIEGNPLIKKGLVKIIKAYIKQDSKINSYYLNREAEPVIQEDQSIEEEKKPRKQRKLSKQIQPKQKNGKVQPYVNEGKHHDNTSNWVVNRFEAPKKLEEIGVQEHMRGVQVSLHKSKMIKEKQSEDEEIIKPKKSKKRDIKSESEVSQEKPKKIAKKNKQTKVVPSESSDESLSESSQKPKKRSKAKPSKKQKKSQKILIKKTKYQSDSEQQKQTPLTKKNKPVFNADMAQNYVNPSSKKPFSRINVEEIGDIPETLKDNTFEAKFKYGQGGDEWGKFGYEKLKDTKGQSFKKTKGKLKNKAFQGANIDFNAVNSIKL